MGLFLPYGRCGWRDGAAPPVTGGVVTDRLAIILGALVVLLIATDLLANGGEVSLFLARKMMDLMEYLIFWR